MFDPLAHVPDVFFLTSFKTPAGFAYKIPITVRTRYFINHVRLVFDRRSEFGERKFLLLSVEGHIYKLNIMPWKNFC